MKEKIEKYKFWYCVFLIMGIFGLLDIVVGVFLIQAGIGFEGRGGLTFMIIYIFAYLFGTKIATSILLLVMWISFTWFVWFGVSAVLHRKIKKLEKAEGITDKMDVKKPISKGFKIALFVLLVPFGILLLIGIIINMFSN